MLDIKQITQANKIAIFAHINPDGDAVGSSLALQKLLTNIGKDTSVFLSQKPEVFNFLPGFDNIKTELDDDDYDLIFVLDCSTIDRVEPFYSENKSFFTKNKIIAIDHHIPSSKGFGSETIAFFEKPDYSSTCGYIFDLFFDPFKKYFDADVATNLFFGIYTDTGGFIHEEDTKRVFDTCSKLFELGANKPLIIDKFVKGRSFEETKFLGEVINRANYQGNILYTHYDINEFEERGINTSPKIGYDILSKIDGPKALVIAKKDGNKIRFGMRSKGIYNVQKVADQFGGGGHKYASGFSVTLEKDEDYIETTKKIVKKIDDLLN